MHTSRLGLDHLAEAAEIMQEAIHGRRSERQACYDTAKGEQRGILNKITFIFQTVVVFIAQFIKRRYGIGANPFDNA